MGREQFSAPEKSKKERALDIVIGIVVGVVGTLLSQVLL